MILYNVTVNIDDSVHDEWLEWMRSKHIPDVLSTGLFTESKLYRIRTENEEEENTYSIQYFLRSMDDYKIYQKEYAEKLQFEHTEKFKDKFVAFRTIMELVA
ncbi:MAG: DUF4286 family protein [Ignavibacteria bacterium]|nr:DUF4286 family protein [Ignavibacteria bacterium]MBK8382864.1 DUF4286 family protein [Ignavibacteria bacterium]MBK9404114.1 DUF4286 family protein [Ignavibacteria bacterium]